MYIVLANAEMHFPQKKVRYSLSEYSQMIISSFHFTCVGWADESGAPYLVQNISELFGELVLSASQELYCNFSACEDEVTGWMKCN